MSEDAVNTEVSVMQESSWNRRSSSPKPTAELKDEFHSKSICGNTVEEMHHVTENLQKASTEASTSEQENVNMGVPLIQDTSQNGRSLDPNPTSGLEDKFDSRSINSYNEEEKEKHQTTENLQKTSVEPAPAEAEFISVEQLRFVGNTVKNLSCEPLGPLPKDANLNGSHINQMGSLADSVTRNSSASTATVSEQSQGFGFGSINNEPLKQKEVISSEIVGAAAEETETSESVLNELVGLPLEDAPSNSIHEKIGLSSLDLALETSLEQSGPLCDDTCKNFGIDGLGHTQKKTSGDPSQTGCTDKATSVQRGKKNTRFLLGSTRVLRSMTQEKSKAPEMNNNVEPSNNPAEDGADRNNRRKRKKKQMKNLPVNEFSRIRNHLRYLLHRIKYEENLIDAYSGEGWKGQSLEKIRPEKELQRAKSEIFRCKLKIRELFQRLDLSCAEGKLPASLFDSEGQIDSEDIFCAKCGSKDFIADNDIILCDGACERGFHQFCLEPPLLKKDIPPDNEGWLCPGCDCKVDCIDLLNDSQGTKLSILDSWEKVFPEAAAAAAAGRNLDDGVGFPSDDSEDDDYNPDFQEVDQKFQSDDSGSDESEFSSEYDDLGDPLHEKQYLGLPSDDSEDDDYDPNGPDHDEQVEQESSSSDFTSDSEDLSVALNDDRSPPMPSLPDNRMHFVGSNGEKLRGTKKQSLSDELSYLLESVPSHLSEKRHVEQLDYKKRHDETYGNDSSDSSDEDYIDIAARKRRKKSMEKNAILSPNEKVSLVKNGTDGTGMKNSQSETKRTSMGTYKNLDVGGSAGSPASALEPGSSSKRTRSTYRRLGEDITQKLFISFKENQYPLRTVKEDLAKELGLTIQQVSKWFENARWSFRHSSSMESSVASTAEQKGTLSPQMVKKQPEGATQMAAKDFSCNGIGTKQPETSPKGNLATEQRNGETSGSQKKARKRAYYSDSRALAQISSDKAPCQSVLIDAPRTQQVRRSGRIQTRSGKSVA